MLQTQELLDIKEAGARATRHIGKTVTPSNITYLINYGRIPKKGATPVAKQDLIDYYESYKREKEWKEKPGDDLNWHLSFDQYKESETIRHVHRLHPYKGKFIPPLAGNIFPNRIRTNSKPKALVIYILLKSISNN